MTIALYHHRARATGRRRRDDGCWLVYGVVGARGLPRCPQRKLRRPNPADRTDATRHGTRPQEEADIWKVGKAECTQILSTPILKLPPTPKMIAARRNHHKSANLGEAFRFFAGRDLDGAHNALVDVNACMAVWFAVKDRQATVDAAAA